MTRMANSFAGQTVLAIHLLGVNRVSQRAKRSLSKLALFLNGTCGSARRFPAPHQRTEGRRAVLLTMTPTAFGMPTVAPLIRDVALTFPVFGTNTLAHMRVNGCYRPVGRPTGRRHADGARAFNKSRAILPEARCVFVASASSPVGARGRLRSLPPSGTGPKAPRDSRCQNLDNLVGNFTAARFGPRVCDPC